MTMAKTVPLASQGKIMNEKTDVGIGISSVELVSVARDNDRNGQCWKTVGKWIVTLNVETYVDLVLEKTVTISTRW